jgi:hypothetical protein
MGGPRENWVWLCPSKSLDVQMVLKLPDWTDSPTTVMRFSSSVAIIWPTAIPLMETYTHTVQFNPKNTSNCRRICILI